MTPNVFTSDTRAFTPKQIKILLKHHHEWDKETVFLDEMHWWSSKMNYWTGDLTAALFFQELIPTHIPGATNWFGYYWTPEDNSKLHIFGMPTFDPVIEAVLVKKSNTLIYSRYQHDFFYDPSGTVAVDGGREYMRIVGNREDYTRVHFNLLTKKFQYHNDKVWYDTAPRKNG